MIMLTFYRLSAQFPAELSGIDPVNIYHVVNLRDSFCKHHQLFIQKYLCRVRSATYKTIRAFMASLLPPEVIKFTYR